MVPDRKLHTEVALPADAPVQLQVLGPVAEAKAHVLRVPLDLCAIVDERFLLVQQTHEPLAGGDELQRLIAFFKVLHRPLDGLRLLLEWSAQTRLRGTFFAAKLLRGHGPGLLDVLAFDLVVKALGERGIQAPPPPLAEGDGSHAAITTDDLPQRQIEFAPPLHVCGVAEGADHEDTGALGRVGELAREDGHRHAEERCNGALAEQRPEAGIVGVCRDADAGSQELGPRRGNSEALLRTFNRELDVIESAGAVAILNLGLGNRRLKVDIPHCGRGDRENVALVKKIEEGELCDGAAVIVDGGVFLIPIHRQADPAPQFFEDLLILLCNATTGLDEVRARDDPRRPFRGGAGGRFKPQILLVGHVDVGPNMEIVLHAPLGWQTVVIPAHGIEDVFAEHPLLADEDVGVGVAEDVADMQRAGDGRRRRVDDEGLLSRAPGIEAVDALIAPHLGEPQLDRIGFEVLR
jgi:hypothetical protein